MNIEINDHPNTYFRLRMTTIIPLSMTILIQIAIPGNFAGSFESICTDNNNFLEINNNSSNDINPGSEYAYALLLGY